MKKTSNILMAVAIIFVVAVMLTLQHGNEPDDETLRMIAGERSRSEQEREKRQYMNLVMFQHTGFAFALILVPLVVAYYQNQQVFKRHRHWKASKLQKRRFSRESSLAGRLLEYYPDLTAYELTLCSLLYKGLTSKEISIELNIAPSSVNTARYRLRKRLSIPAGEEFVTFLHKIRAF